MKPHKLFVRHSEDVAKLYFSKITNQMLVELNFRICVDDRRSSTFERVLTLKNAKRLQKWLDRAIKEMEEK